MPEIIDLNITFDEWFHETENFSTRSERFYWDFPPEYHLLAKEWLKAAYLQGCRDVAQDACDTLMDYATSLCGIDSSLTYTESYDNASANLRVYFTKVLDNADKE